MKILFDDIEEFYAYQEGRGRSPEVDYGVHWRGTCSWPRYRISFVVDTGEVYAVRQEHGGGVILLATGLPTGPEGYAKVEQLLFGWEGVCGEPLSLAWAHDRLNEYSPVVVDEGTNLW